MKRRKERKRKEYSGSKSFDGSCRNHGGCGYCEQARTFAKRRLKALAQDEIDEYETTTENRGEES